MKHTGNLKTFFEVWSLDFWTWGWTPSTGLLPVTEVPKGLGFVGFLYHCVSLTPLQHYHNGVGIKQTRQKRGRTEFSIHFTDTFFLIQISLDVIFRYILLRTVHIPNLVF